MPIMPNSSGGDPGVSTTLRITRSIKRACGDCHARKVKCDGAINGFPCRNCRLAKVHCVVPDKRKRRARVSGQSSASGDKGLAIPVSTRRRIVTAEPGPIPAEPIAHEHDEGSAHPRVCHRTADAEYARQNLVEFFSQNLLEKPIQTRLTYIGSDLSTLGYLVRQQSTNQRVHHYPSSNSYAPRIPGLQGVPAPNLIPKDAFVLPPKSVSDILIGAYFEHIHGLFPIIDREEFLAQYEAPTSAPPLLLFHAICLAGSHATSTLDNTQELKGAFFRRAKALFDGRYEEDRMHMVQAALLLTWFSDGGDDVCTNAWYWIGVATRIALGLGMHRDVGPSKMLERDKRTWRKIWWCLVQFDVLVSLCYGRPQNINLDDCDTPPLSVEDFDASTSEDEASFCIYHAKLCADISILLRTHFTLKTQKSPSNWSASLQALDLKLAEWLLSLPPALRDRSQPTSVYKAMLFLTYETTLVQVHRLRLSSTGDVPAMDLLNNDRICIEAASKIISIFEEMDKLSALQNCWFCAPNALFTALVQVQAQLRSENPIISLRAQENYASGLRILQQLSQHWLMAASVWRLFQFGPRTDDTRMTTQEVLPNIGNLSEQNFEGEGLQSIANQTASKQKATEQETLTEEREWINFLSFEEEQPGDLHIQPNRWEESSSEWQSLYWRDSIGGLDLQQPDPPRSIP
ncbi:hypothetical protein N5P37_012120 [Trichoderma harzianum]|nr:hypothetical protein N5P37_012120 [Trichoderma harzianum]